MKKIQWFTICLLLLMLTFTLDAQDDFVVSGYIDYAYTLGETSYQSVYDLGTRQEIRLMENPSSLYGAALSPLGEQIVFVSDHNGNEDIYIMNVDGTNLQQLTDSPYSKYPLIWSPDGNWIAYTLDTGVNFATRHTEIYLVNADGTEHIQLTSGEYSSFSPVWSPDGTKIVYCYGGRQANYIDLYLMNADGSDKRKLVNAGFCGPVWHPNGEQIAYEADDGSIHILDISKENDFELMSGDIAGVWLRWSPDGTKIMMRGAGVDYNEEFYYINSDGTEFTQITHNEGDTGLSQWLGNNCIIFEVPHTGFQGGLVIIGIDGTNRTEVEIPIPYLPRDSSWNGLNSWYISATCPSDGMLYTSWEQWS